MNIGKGFSLALMPIAALLLITIIYSSWSLLGNMRGLNVCTGALQCLQCFMLPGTLLIEIGLLVYIGYLIAKGGLELTDAAIVGGISAAISVFISQIIGIVIQLLGFGTIAAGNLMQNNDNAVPQMIFGGLFTGLGIIGSVICMFIWAGVGFVIGAVLAAIGALVAGTKK